MVGRLVLSSPLLSVKEAINRTQPSFCSVLLSNSSSRVCETVRTKRGRRARRVPAADHESRDGFCASTTNRRPVYETLLRDRRDASTPENGEKLVLACRNFFRGNWRTELRRSSLESEELRDQTVQDNNLRRAPPTVIRCCNV